MSQRALINLAPQPGISSVLWDCLGLPWKVQQSILGKFYCVLLLCWSLGWKKRSEHGYYFGPLNQMWKNAKNDVGMAKQRLFQIGEKPVLRLLSGVSAGHSTFKWQFLKINLQLLQICHRASEMLCCCLRSCCWHKPVTVICFAHKLALHISLVCGSAGSAQLPSSTQLDEVAHTANHGGDPHKDTILLGLQGIRTAVRGRICVRDKICMKNTQQMEKTCWYTHLVVMIKWRLQCSTPQLAENEGSTKISHIDAYLMEALGTC